MKINIDHGISTGDRTVYDEITLRKLKRKEVMNWLIRNRLIDMDSWRMDIEGNITFHPERPKRLPIDWHLGGAKA